MKHKTHDPPLDFFQVFGFLLCFMQGGIGRDVLHSQKTKAYTTGHLGVKEKICAKFEEIFAQLPPLRGRQAEAASQAVRNTPYSPRAPVRWKKTYRESRGVHVVADLIGKRLREYMPDSGASRKRNRKNIPEALPHSKMTKAIRDNMPLLLSTTDRVFGWRVRCRYNTIARVFTLELRALNAEYPKWFAMPRKRQEKLVANFLHTHRSSLKPNIVKKMSAKIRTQDEHTLAMAVCSQQKLLSHLIKKHNIRYSNIHNIDEIFFTKVGSIGRTTLGWEGSEVTVTDPSSRRGGWMALSHASPTIGVRVYIYTKSTQKKWNDCPADHYKITRRGNRVFTINIPPNCNISRANHLRIIQHLFAMPNPGEKDLDSYDKAGPHSGALISEAYLCMGRVPACPDIGGWTPISQFLDGHICHGSMKNTIGDHATDHFISEGKRLEQLRRRDKPSPISLDQLCGWLDGWCTSIGTTAMVKEEMPLYYPPIGNAKDKRREPIKKCFEFIRTHGTVQFEKEQKTFGRDTDIINVKGVGEVTAAALNRLGVRTVGDFVDSDEEKKLPARVVRLNIATAVQYCKDVMNGTEADPFLKPPAVCPRCGMTYSGAGKLFREHCQRNDRCFYRLTTPFVPRFTGSNPNDPQSYNPKGRRFYFQKKMEDGSVVRCKGVFLNESATVIKYCDKHGQTTIYRGDWTQLIWNKIRYVHE